MNDPKEAVYTFLQQNNIPYQTCSHPAVYTIEEMMAQNIPHSEAIAKNLFVRDDNKRHYYLIVIRGEKRVDLNSLPKLPIPAAWDLLPKKTFFPSCR